MSATVKVGGRDVTIGRFSMAKAMRVMTLVSKINKEIPALMKTAAEFKRGYREDNALMIDRVEAWHRFGDPQPVYDDDGNPVVVDGKVVTVPSYIERMTEKDWEAAGGYLRLRQSPSTEEVALAVLAEGYERLEEPLLRFMALVCMSNADVGEFVREGTIWEEVDKYVKSHLYDAGVEEVLELLVVGYEQAEQQVVGKFEQLGDRVGKLMAAIGFQPREKPETTTTETTSSSEPETSSSPSPSPSPTSSDGTPTESDDSRSTPSLASH